MLIKPLERAICMSSELISERVLGLNSQLVIYIVIPLPHFEHDHMQHHKQNIKSVLSMCSVLQHLNSLTIVSGNKIIFMSTIQLLCG